MAKLIGAKTGWLRRYMMPGFLFLAFLSMSRVTQICGVVFILSIYFLVAYLTPTMAHYTHVHVESVNRAAVLSVRNLSGAIASAIFSHFLGYIAYTYSLMSSLLCSAAIVFILSVMMFPFFKLNTKTV
jgi:small-conductance mechanosensitive channel